MGLGLQKLVSHGGLLGLVLVEREPFLGLSVAPDYRGQNTTDHNMWDWAKESVGLVDWLCEFSEGGSVEGRVFGDFYHFPYWVPLQTSACS